MLRTEEGLGQLERARATSTESERAKDAPDLPPFPVERPAPDPHPPLPLPRVDLLPRALDLVLLHRRSLGPLCRPHRLALALDRPEERAEHALRRLVGAFGEQPHERRAHDGEREAQRRAAHRGCECREEGRAREARADGDGEDGRRRGGRARGRGRARLGGRERGEARLKLAPEENGGERDATLGLPRRAARVPLLLLLLRVAAVGRLERVVEVVRAELGRLRGGDGVQRADSADDAEWRRRRARRLNEDGEEELDERVPAREAPHAVPRQALVGRRALRGPVLRCAERERRRVGGGGPGRVALEEDDAVEPHLVLAHHAGARILAPPQDECPDRVDRGEVALVGVQALVARRLAQEDDELDDGGRGRARVQRDDLRAALGERLEDREARAREGALRAWERRGGESARASSFRATRTVKRTYRQ